MIIALFVILDHPLLDTFRGNVKSQMNKSVRAFGSGKDSKLYCIQRASCIAACHIRKKFHSILLDNSSVISHASVAVIYSPEDQGLNILIAQSLQLKDNGAGQKSAVYFKIRVFCSCADQDDCSVLYKRKKIILLSFVKAMDLINKKNRLFAVHAQIILGFFYNGFHIFFSCYSCIDLSKISAGSIGYYFCQCCFACSGRSVKDNRGQFISLDSAVQQLVFSYNMFLAYDFFQGSRAETGGKRRFSVQCF